MSSSDTIALQNEVVPYIRFKMVELPQTGNIEIIQFSSDLSVSKDTTQNSGSARYHARQSPKKIVLSKKNEDPLLIGGPNPQKHKNTHFVKNLFYFCVVIK